MAATNLRRLLRLCIKSAETTKNDKRRIELIRIAMLLSGKHSDEELQELSPEMKELLGFGK